MEINTVFNPFVSLFVFIGNIVMLMSLTGYRRSKKVIAITLSILLISIWGFTLFSVQNMNESFIIKFTPLLTAIACAGTIYFLSDQSVSQWLFTILTQFNIFCIIMGIGFISAKYNLENAIWINSVIRLILYMVTIFIIFRFLRKPYLYVLERIKKGFVSLIPVSIGFLVLFVSIPNSPEKNYGNNSIWLFAVTAIVVILTYFVLFKTLRSMLRQSEYEREEEHFKSQETLLLSQIIAQDELIGITKQAQHDLKYHNRILASFLEQNNIEGARNYIRDYENSMPGPTLTEYCKHHVANGVICLYDKNAKEYDIKFSAQADIPAQLSLPASDLCAILSNLLDNAVEGCKKSHKDRFILLTAHHDNGRLTLEVRNTLAETLVFHNGIPCSTKVQKSGLGLPGVRRLAEKHRGMMRLTATEGEFIAQIILYS